MVRHVIATRTLTVLAAILLVGAFTLGTVLPPDLPLAAALTMLDHTLVSRMQGLAHQYFPGWAWEHLAVPLLVRPVWLLPASLGVVVAGVAATLASSTGPSRSRRRRS
jgi:hypothetical protein